MSVLLDLGSTLIQGGHADELALQESDVGLLDSKWVALNTVEYVAWHQLGSKFCLLLVPWKTPRHRELQVHVSTCGHLLAAGMQAVALIQRFNVHVIMGTPTPHLLMWAMTIFVRALQHPVIGGLPITSIPMLFSGMVRSVRVVVVAISSTILRTSPRTCPLLPQKKLNYDSA